MRYRERDYKDPKYKGWRYSVFVRDEWSCQMCGGKKNLQAHHIKRWASYPSLRYKSFNGITLCKNCHELVTGREEQYESKFKTIIKQKGKAFTFKRKKKNKLKLKKRPKVYLDPRI